MLTIKRTNISVKGISKINISRKGLLYRIKESRIAFINHPVHPKKNDIAITLELNQFLSCNPITHHPYEPYRIQSVNNSI